jgi:hypothetical protein
LISYDCQYFIEWCFVIPSIWHLTNHFRRPNLID